MANLDEVYGIDDRSAAFEAHQSGLLVSLAGPGTGKTFSLIRRIRHLVEEKEVPAEDICYLTFIKEISRAFLSEYLQQVPADSAPPRVQTLHSFACRILRNRGFSLGYDGPLYFASIADKDQHDSKIFISDALTLMPVEHGLTAPGMRALLSKVKEAWRNSSAPESLPAPIPSLLPRPSYC